MNVYDTIWEGYRVSTCVKQLERNKDAGKNTTHKYMSVIFKYPAL